MNIPEISIVVPIYNAEKYLRHCLDSLINQTMQDIEIICVNDGSKDNSLMILQEYAKRDKRIILLDQSNGGVSVARNNALKKYPVNIICFLIAMIGLTLTHVRWHIILLSERMQIA